MLLVVVLLVLNTVPTIRKDHSTKQHGTVFVQLLKTLVAENWVHLRPKHTRIWVVWPLEVFLHPIHHGTSDLEQCDFLMCV